ncbi:MAG: hypothetical protein KKD92_04200 [Proteobacteria bacterium]|nr:hypothetical protein [Pseudomonadota bacterium]OQW99114.1 MAG: hypothetical protein BWK74_02970 [Desulfobacteraceae bacterium A6]
MKLKLFFMIALFFLFAGCEYETSLTDEHKIPVDKAVLGLWEAVPEKKRVSDPKDRVSDSEERLMVLKYTDTEYIVHYPTGDEGFYFKGYPIRIGGISCVQIQLIGDSNGDIKSGDRKYHVVSYQFVNGELEIKTMNTDLVDKNIKDRNKLKTAFLKNKNKGELFTNPVRFKRAVKKS